MSERPQPAPQATTGHGEKITLCPAEMRDVDPILTARRRGHMTAAVRAAVGFDFDELGLEGIEWRAGVGNAASKRVGGKAGFVYEVIQRGERRDTRFSAIIGADAR